jgi:F-type H+-transporting ATPase subunit epsilon
MNTFTLHLQDAAQYERIESVTSFVGQDQSGSFGILAGHGRFMTTLVVGLARFQTADGAWHFLASPGGLAYFKGDHLYLSTRRYLRDTDYTRIAAALEDQILREEAGLRGLKASLRRLEEEMLKRLWRLRRKGRSFS